MKLGFFPTKLGLIFVFIFFSLCVSADTTPEQVESYYQRITGYSMKRSDWEKLGLSAEGLSIIKANDLMEILSNSDGFVENRLASFLSSISNLEEDPFTDFNDFQASWLLAIKAGIDIRKIFTSNYYISRASSGGEIFGSRQFHFGLGIDGIKDFSQEFSLIFDPDVQHNQSEAAYDSVLSTNAFGKYLVDTNRTGVKAVYESFLCSSFGSIKDSTLDDFYVGPDIDRKPEGNAELYQNDCRGCHTILDSNRGAFANYSFDEDAKRLSKSKSVNSNYNRNPRFQQAYVTQLDFWENLLMDPLSQDRFGWRGENSGRGIQSYGRLIVNSKRFQVCMTQRLAKEFCELSDDDLFDTSKNVEIDRIATLFREEDKYNMKKLIFRLVRSPLCE